MSFLFVAALALPAPAEPVPSPGAAVALKLSSEAPIYLPGGEIEVGVVLDPTQLGFSGAAQIELQLSSASQGAALWSETRDVILGQAATLDFQATAPLHDGRYWLHAIVTAPGTFRTRLLPGGGARVLGEARRQVLVMSSESTSRPTAAWLPGTEIDPTTHRWWERSPDWLRTRRLAWFSEGPLSFGTLRPVVVQGRRYIEIPAGDSGIAAAWQLIPLSVQTPGAAHLIEVATPLGADQALTLTIVEPDSTGRLGPVGASVMQVSTPNDVGGDGATARRLFWPRTTQPLLMLSNGRSDAPASYASVRVRRCGEAPRQASPTQERLVVIDGSNEVAPADLANGAKLARGDWHAAYLGARVLADLVELKGANTAMIRGSSANDDPWQETVMREFDRRGLRVLVRGDLHDPISGGATPSDRPMDEVDPRLDGILAAASAHRCFAGIAIELEPGATALAPPPWTPSAAQLDLFLEQNKLAWPEAAARDDATISAALAGPWREAWLEWRAEQLTGRYRAIRERVAVVGADLKVFLLTDAMLADDRAAERLRPRLNSPTTAASFLMEHGVDARAIAEIPGLELIVAERLGSQGSLGKDALALASVRFADLGAGKQQPVAALQRDVRLVRLESFEQARGCPDCTLRSVVRTSNRRERMAMSRVTSERDAVALLESSDAIDLSFDEPDRRTRLLIRELPPPGVSVAATSQPVYVRAYTRGPGRLVAFSNVSPWPVRATTTLSNEAGCDAMEIKPWESQPPVASRLERGQHAFEFDLAPFETRLLAVSDRDAKVVGLRTNTPAEAETELRRIVDDLKRRDLNARRPLEGVLDPSFELTLPGGAPSVWDAAVTGASRVTTVTESPLSGERSLRIESREGTTSAASKPFPVPSSGQLAVQFGVRPVELDGDARVVISFDSVDGAYHSATSIAAAGLRADAQKAAWPAYVFGVDDLPVGQDGGMRITLSCTGAGVVDIDDLQCFSLFYPMQSFPETKWQRLALVRIVQSAEVALDDGRYSECLQIVDGYWPRFLREFAPRLPEPAVPPPATAQREETEGPAPAPTLSERLKGWTPSFWR
ncbi:hypothetical protein [Pirellulimonas nuda]|uniref:hypothetical protein n=1 Tax=Pirellulimonas nuda TaxID=2528009 RepID=UPI0011A38BDF|nr:hypothetical protein [Pirellulimonas nuda]